MKKLFLSLIVSSVIFTGLHAQEAGTTVVLLNYNTVQKKVAKSDTDIQNPKKSVKASTWMKRGEIHQDAFMVGLEQIQEGAATTNLVLFYGEPNSIDTETEDGSQKEIYQYDHMNYTFVNGALNEWEKKDPIVDDPLRIALDAYNKALELDENAKLGEKVKEHLTDLKGQFKQEGVNSYYKNNYKGALQAFENVLEVNNLELFAGEFDTVMVQYSGIISREIAGKTDDKELYMKAIGYYQQLAKVNYGSTNTYLQIKMDYLSIGDTLQALETVKEAYAKYPDSINIIANIADTYILLKQFDEGVEFMDKVIEGNPSIAEAYYWKGRLLLNKEEVEFIEQAIEAYEKAGELDPTIYYIWYDLGYIYYLQGADFYDRANTEEHDPTRIRLLELGKEKYTEAIPILEKAYELNSENLAVKSETLDLLQRIYYKEQMMDDYERIKELKNSL
ncbi:MAG: tetratricopeptide repeat protein [Bacteroidota bacterium]